MNIEFYVQTPQPDNPESPQYQPRRWKAGVDIDHDLELFDFVCISFLYGLPLFFLAILLLSKPDPGQPAHIPTAPSAEIIAPSTPKEIN